VQAAVVARAEALGGERGAQAVTSSIYPVRPSVCRACHAVDTPDLCHADDGKNPPTRTMHFVPLENLRRKLRGLELAMHHALGGPRMQAEALCEAIYRRLTHPPPAPAGQP